MIIQIRKIVQISNQKWQSRTLTNKSFSSIRLGNAQRFVLLKILVNEKTIVILMSHDLTIIWLGGISGRDVKT